MQEIREIEGVSGLHIMAYRQEQSIGKSYRALAFGRTYTVEPRNPGFPPSRPGDTPRDDNRSQFCQQGSSHRL
ncbi:MAG: hypothetical protein Ct9H300mP16_16520 [Pseudomonadota bacterium]|nr:MAG: hypothetical protein Ct9H300mP16_16520 [Pseudomonadota bacterium]